MKKQIIGLIALISMSLSGCLSKCNSVRKEDDQQVTSVEVQLENKEVDRVQQDQTLDVIEGDSFKLDSAKLRSLNDLVLWIHRM